jgi:heme/copper-type cytochrome/quinol oxidase subunit 1
MAYHCRAIRTGGAKAMKLPDFSFKSEAKWILALTVLVPLIAALLALLIPWLLR